VVEVALLHRHGGWGVKHDSWGSTALPELFKAELSRSAMELAKNTGSCSIDNKCPYHINDATDVVCFSVDCTMLMGDGGGGQAPLEYGNFSKKGFRSFEWEKLNFTTFDPP